MSGADLSATGVWKTIDDKTHQTRGTVRLYEKNGVLFGRIESSADPKTSKEVCDLCDGDRKNQPIIGLVFLRNMKKQGAAEYNGGDILDPDTGVVYRCKMTLADGGKRLVVRGFIGVSVFGRSQTWLRDE